MIIKAIDSTLWRAYIAPINNPAKGVRDMKRMLFAAAIVAATASPAVAQQFYTTSPRIGGGWVTTPNVSPNYGAAGAGEQWTTTPRIGGGWSTTNNFGQRWTTTPNIGGGYTTSPNR